jgi:adenine deaminase
MTLSKGKLARLVGGAMGEIKADLIITGGRVINSYSGEILDGMEIAVLDGRICYVGPSARHGVVWDKEVSYTHLRDH